MSLKQNYENYMEKQNALKETYMSRFWIDQEKRYIKPFQIYGNLYYVGDSWVCAHIVDTGDGLLLFDAGNTGATAMLIQSVWEMGFRPDDVKWLILSHGHVDHIGGANFFRNMFGTKIYLGAPDAEMFRENPEYSMIQDNPDCFETLFIPDEEIREGDKIQFGNTEVTFFMVPGHTAGCIACFFDVTDGIEKKRVGYYGGFGFNTLKKDFLLEMGDDRYRMRDVYIQSLQKVRDQKVDIFMGNHTENVDLLNKRKMMLENPGKNPFVDDQAWKCYLDKKRDELLALMSDPSQN